MGRSALSGTMMITEVLATAMAQAYGSEVMLRARRTAIGPVANAASAGLHASTMRRGISPGLAKQ
ncbi:MAG TPA: hypothetical protein DHV85_23010 [Candidatus Accumulibacter sp.]|nr:hypothetical protein [Accumulibacter sp.]